MRRSPNRLILAGVLVLISIGLIFVGSRSGIFRVIVSIFMTPITPAAGVVTDGAEAAADLAQPQEDYDTLLARNRELERTVAELQVEIVRLREIEQDYYRLSGLLNYVSERPDQNVVTADVVAHDTSGYLRWVIINRGARDGIAAGNPVISDLGLVGRVEEVAADSAWVRLLIDPDSTVDAILQDARAEGSVVGELQGGLRMELIPQEAVVEVGDLALTSGLGGSFPAGIVIGQVASVRRQTAALFQEAEIHPTVDFSHLEIVAVITSFQPIDLSIFDETIAGESGP